MDLITAKSLCVTLMTEHGLIRQGWEHAFSDTKVRVAECSYRERTIYVSRLMVLHADATMVEQTMLHEIAHALTRGHKHDAVWKSTAKSLGYSGARKQVNPYVMVEHMNLLENALLMPGTPVDSIGVGDMIHSERHSTTALIVKKSRKNFYAIDENIKVYAVPFDQALRFKVPRGSVPFDVLR